MSPVEHLLDRLVRPESGVQSVLLYGAQGAGQTEWARKVASAWLCARADGLNRCEECPVCKSIENGREVDLLRIAPSGPSRQIAKRQISPSEDRKDAPLSLIEFFRTRPLVARSKVALILDVDRLGSDAANSLLKTLEEPRPDFRLVLTSDEVGNVLPTILSRCLCVAIPRDSTGHEVELVRVLGESSPGLMRRVETHLAAYTAIWEMFESLPSSPIRFALLRAEQLLTLADKLPTDELGGARAANTEMARLLGAWWSYRMPSEPQGRLLIAEYHRRVLGNGNAQLAADALFCGLLSLLAVGEPVGGKTA